MSDLGGSEGWWWGMLWIFPYLRTDIISNVSVSVSVSALNQNINKTSVHSPYVRQALSLLSLAWITPWNGWEVFSLTWKKRNVNIKLNTSFLSNSPSWSPGCRWRSRWVRAPSLGSGSDSGSGQPPNSNLCSVFVCGAGCYEATIEQSGLFVWQSPSQWFLSCW